MGIVDSVAVVLPIYNPDDSFKQVLEQIQRQTYTPNKVIVLDSSSKKFRIQDYAIEQVEYERIEHFDHGNTRNHGARLAEGNDAIVLLTQDAIMTDTCIEELVQFVNQHALSAAYARQLPRKGATSIEVFERTFNYLAKSQVRKSAPKCIDDVYFSDSCSLVVLKDLLAVDGYPRKILTAEDMILASKLLNHGYAIGYAADAQVWHSHRPNLKGTFKRYFDTGCMHSDWRDELPLENVGGKGGTFVREGVKFLLRRDPLAVATFIANAFSRALGYYLGRRYRWFPQSLRKKWSSNPSYWEPMSEGAVAEKEF